MDSFWTNMSKRQEQAQSWVRESEKNMNESTEEAIYQSNEDGETYEKQGDFPTDSELCSEQTADIWIPPKYTAYSSEDDKPEKIKENKRTEIDKGCSDEDVSCHAAKTQCGSYDTKKILKEQVITLYRNLEIFLTCDEFGEDLRNELQESNPNYLQVLEKRIRDMGKCDHGIVIAGETSAGKTTFINKILRKPLFKTRTVESTSVICKIRNSKTVRIIKERMSGETEMEDLTDECDPETKQGVKQLRKMLEKLTDKKSKESLEYRSVDIGFPISFLKGNTILVDTPGIGANKEVTRKLKEYLPQAVSFVFVIDASRAGGMQSDRLPEILRSIILLKMDNEMPCLDPEDVLFITNKWDCIPKDANDRDSDDEDDETATWTQLKSDIKLCWPLVNDENIYKLNLKDISPDEDNNSAKEFNKFQRALETNIKKARNVRIVHHLRFFLEILKNISRGLRARLDLNKMSEEEQIALAATQQIKIETLYEDCIKVKEKLNAKTEKLIEDAAKACYDYMSTDEGKKEILDPDGSMSMLPWIPGTFAHYVNTRISLFVNKFMQSEEILKGFHNIRKEAESFYKKICLDLLRMENGWTDEAVDEIGDGEEMAIEFSDDDSIPTRTIVGVAIATSPIWIPLLAAGLALCIGAVGVTLVVSPVLLPAMALLNRDEKKKKIIDAEYENCKESVRSLVKNHLKSTYGVVLEKLIDKLTVDVLPRRIDTLNKRRQQLLELRQEILANRDVLVSLAVRVKSMEEEATKMQKCLQQDILDTEGN